jgi:hypothetical protein
VSGSSLAGSGIHSGSSIDGFSADDIAAMQLMSGCGTPAHPIPGPPPD